MKIKTPYGWMGGQKSAAAGFLASSVFLFCACSWSPAFAAQPVISIRSDSWYPFNDKPDDAKPGYVVETMKLIFEPKGYTLDYQIMPWKRAIAEGEKGAIHGIIGAIKSDAPTFVFPEEPAGVSDTTFFVKKGSTWKYAGIDSFKGKCLGVSAGYAYEDPLGAYLKANAGNARLINESAGDQPLELGIKKLQADRVDICVEASIVFWTRVDRMGISRDSFMDAGMLGETEPLYVAFSPAKPESKDLAKTFSEGIRALRKSGELGRVLAKYGVKDWVK